MTQWGDDPAEIRRRDEVIRAAVDEITRSPWRLLRNWRLAREARAVIALNAAEGVPGRVGQGPQQEPEAPPRDLPA